MGYRHIKREDLPTNVEEIVFRGIYEHRILDGGFSFQVFRKGLLEDMIKDIISILNEGYRKEQELSDKEHEESEYKEYLRLKTKYENGT